MDYFNIDYRHYTFHRVLAELDFLISYYKDTIGDEARAKEAIDEVLKLRDEVERIYSEQNKFKR